MVEIVISAKTEQRAKDLINQCLPSTIRDLWSFFQELADCLWQIRAEIDDYIDSFPRNGTIPINFRYDSRFDDTKLAQLEKNLLKKMNRCSSEAKRLEKEKQKIALESLKGEQINGQVER